MRLSIVDMNLYWKTAIIFTGLLWGGCTVGPDYHRPPPAASQPLPEAFTIDGVAWKTAAPAADLPRGEWWRVFGREDLNRLEQLAATNNQQLAASVAALAQARALVGEAR